MAEVDQGARQSPRFILLYALAVAGGAVAYVPFLTVLLPVRITALSGASDVVWLGYATFAGACAASLFNILFGWLSDVTGNRRGWILGGLLLSSFFLVSMTRVETLAQLVGAILAWQLSLNMMLGPLAAWAGDTVPDRQKGTLGGLLAFAHALGAASGALVTIAGLASADGRLMLVAAMVITMVVPVLLFGRPRPMPHLMKLEVRERQAPDLRRSRVVRMWLARLLVQIAEAALFAYLLFWLRDIDPAFGDDDTARIFAVVIALAVPVSMFAGRWSDLTARPILPLAIAALVGAVGLVIMALQDGLPMAIGGYLVFGLSTSVFLSLHTSQTLRVLPRPRTRGRDLGLFNLTNTVPSLIMPWLTLGLVPSFGFATLLALLAVLVATGALLLASMPRLN